MEKSKCAPPHSIMLTKALMKGSTMLQGLINLGGMKKVWTVPSQASVVYCV